MIRRPLRRGALGAVVLSLLLAAPASAHPFFDPAEVPVDSLAPVTLELAHGCGAEDHDGDDTQAGEEPTREVAIEVPEAVTFVDPAERDGWDLHIERGDDDRVEVVVYSAEEGTDEPAPAFDLEVVHTGDVGDEVPWRVMQACDETTHRWVGTAQEPAEDPAVTVTLVDADPAAPPPDPDTAAVEEVPDEPVEADEADAADDGAADEPEPDPEDLDEQDLTAGEDEGTGMPGWVLIVVLLVALAVAGGVLLVRTREPGASAPDDPAS